MAQPDSILCPVRAYKRMLEAIPAPKDSSAFVIPVNRRLTDFTYSRFQKCLKSLITLTGRNPRLYSSHSMRRGGATSAFMAGVPTKVIQTQGDWASDSYLRYIKLPASERLELAEKLAEFSHQPRWARRVRPVGFREHSEHREKSLSATSSGEEVYRAPRGTVQVFLCFVGQVDVL